MKINREALLKLAADEEEKIIIARSLDLAEQVFSDVLPKCGPFLNPKEQDLYETIWRQIDGIIYRFDGGFRDAERRRGIVLPDFYGSDPVDTKITAILIQGKFPADISHRDFLGSILGTGLDRSRIGDILVVEGGAQVIIDRDIKNYLLQNLEKVSSYPVDLSEIDLEQIVTGDERVKEIRTTVSSLRLDAVAASGFGMSRTAMSREIKAGRVKLNWKEVDTPSQDVKEGDIISIRGRGRVEIAKTGGQTRKGRTHLNLKRYI
ncbi:MAG TPA: photosystem II S4 domain protein [Firmicutes bacterium]|jgi:RNA-binding protein YlmH|nr:photosystem II S4 domain protein [Bacillota bacterium]